MSRTKARVRFPFVSWDCSAALSLTIDSLQKKIEKDQRLYYLDYYRGFTHTIVESHTKEKIFFSLSLPDPYLPTTTLTLRQRGSRPFFNYVDKILPIIDHLPTPS